ncbi:PHOSPHATE-RESPONSIVE 1 FAMILY PROTEIN [Salix viminalis]|uniref:PHOSPHATE-RESPONSIVE 1 FAMILY PROTEIN n=1 Tax=Salix viminalis TaxID=40686 RepID=A0A9Q0UHZ3_SALVM|nr:PHOSPHATE-RESPONSIVE 1 FAMILY PROTEIN [Salix viminalis]
MGSSVSFRLVLLLQAAFLVSAARKLAGSDQTDQQPFLFRYHNGPLLTGNISINLIWYGKFKPSQRAIVTDFIASLVSSKPTSAQFSVAKWWKGTEKYYQAIGVPRKHHWRLHQPVPGVYGKGSYPGYAGDVLVDSATGASYNAHGVNSRKYLLPALFDPSTATCATLV